MIKGHLTPEVLLGDMPLPAHWAKAKFAFVCYTPCPKGFESYLVEVSKERYFLHSPTSEVRLCQYLDIPFIVISEVYGFPVGATTVEELAYRGIETIIGVGYAGAFGAAPLGKKFVAVDTISDLPQARHYGVEALQAVQPSKRLFNSLMNHIKKDQAEWGRFRVWNSNSLYREHSKLVQQMKDHGCEAVNMDVLSLYAVAPVCAVEMGRDIEYIYVGTVTDAEGAGDGNWSSDLSDLVRGDGENSHDHLVRWMVENFLVKI
jgi:uridine phosphorylase